MIFLFLCVFFLHVCSISQSLADEAQISTAGKPSSNFIAEALQRKKAQNWAKMLL